MKRAGPLAQLAAAFARKGETSPAGAAGPVQETTAKTGSGADRAIVCSECGQPITRTAAAIEVAGAHAHTFMNPGGFVFEIACYRDAPGARAFGEPSSEWSWFPGFSWQIALCTACTTHLGWRFRGEGGGHFGLIRDRISEAGD